MSKLVGAVRLLAEELENAEGALAGDRDCGNERESLESLVRAGRAVVENWDNC